LQKDVGNMRDTCTITINVKRMWHHIDTIYIVTGISVLQRVIIILWLQ